MSDLSPMTAPPERRRFALARLASAARRQDWFAVVLEVLVVVIGVVVGFQVTAWGQARSDRAKEQASLRQLAADLAETELRMTRYDSLFAAPELATARLIRAFYTPERPPRDSLAAWLLTSNTISNARPVLGTAEALVATGDLRLIRDDSLRSAITAYIEDARRGSYVQDLLVEEWLRAWREMASEVDIIEVTLPSIRDDAIRQGYRLGRLETAFFDGPRRTPAPLDAERFLSSPVTRQSSYDQFEARGNLLQSREAMRRAAAALRQRIEAQITP